MANRRGQGTTEESGQLPDGYLNAGGVGKDCGGAVKVAKGAVTGQNIPSLGFLTPTNLSEVREITVGKT